MNYQDVIRNESSRRNIYKGLSQCFQIPEDGLGVILRKLKNEFSKLDSQAKPIVKLLCDSYGENNGLKNIHIDYARLFVGPYSLLAPPYGSVYLDGRHQIMCESTVDAMRYYNDAGLEVALNFKEAPDHISTELEFMYFLIHEELSAIGFGDTQNVYDSLSLQREFLSNHLSQWAGSFANAVKGNAKTEFYASIADILANFIAEDENYLASLQALPTTDSNKVEKTC